MYDSMYLAEERDLRLAIATIGLSVCEENFLIKLNNALNLVCFILEHFGAF